MAKKSPHGKTRLAGQFFEAGEVLQILLCSSVLLVLILDLRLSPAGCLHSWVIPGSSGVQFGASLANLTPTLFSASASSSAPASDQLLLLPLLLVCSFVRLVVCLFVCLCVCLSG